MKAAAKGALEGLGGEKNKNPQKHIQLCIKIYSSSLFHELYPLAKRDIRNFS